MADNNTPAADYKPTVKYQVYHIKTKRQTSLLFFRLKYLNDQKMHPMAEHKPQKHPSNHWQIEKRIMRKHDVKYLVKRMPINKRVPDMFFYFIYIHVFLYMSIRIKRTII
jgi:hypothetical protein